MARVEGLFGQAVDRIGGEPISSRMARRAPIRHLDPSLLLITLMLTAFGAVMIFSATATKQEEAGLDPGAFLKRQIAAAVVGVIVLLVFSLFDYRHLKALSPVIYGVTVVALILVLTPAGELVNGTRSWFRFGAFQLQPGELAKLAVILAAGAYMSERKEGMSFLDVLAVIGIIGLPMLLIFVQPDFGTMLVFVILAAALLLVGGTRVRHLLFLTFVTFVAVVIALQSNVLKPYQVERLTAFMDPNPDVQSAGYNLTQSKIAIASGGFRGQGLQAENTQTALDFVPEQHTDFIFTAVGEQLGFVGSAALLTMLAFLMWRAVRIAAMSRDLFGTLIATGIAAMWAFQIFQNVGMTMGIMPITGIPLPFISYGGSSTLTNFMAVGLLLNIHMRRFL